MVPAKLENYSRTRREVMEDKEAVKSGEYQNPDELRGEVNERADSVNMKCSICGNYVDKIFQQDACKPCLVRAFQKHIYMINDFRGK